MLDRIKNKLNIIFRPKAYLIELRFRTMFPYGERKGKVNMRLARIIDDLCEKIGFEKHTEVGNYESIRLKGINSEIVITVDHIESNQLNILVKRKDKNNASEIINLNQADKEYDYRNVTMLCMALDNF